MFPSILNVEVLSFSQKSRHAISTPGAGAPEGERAGAEEIATGQGTGQVLCRRWGQVDWSALVGLVGRSGVGWHWLVWLVLYRCVGT